MAKKKSTGRPRKDPNGERTKTYTVSALPSKVKKIKSTYGGLSAAIEQIKTDDKK